MTFAKRLKSIRTERGLTQQKVADGVGIHRSLLTYYERGENEPSAHTLCSMADYFGVTTDYLLGRTDRR
nr:helix-turn-helix transcriptional regulator [uncultured Caproiciproducens sp.]